MVIILCVYNLYYLRKIQWGKQMVAADQYKILRKIIQYKKKVGNNHNWIILSDDFIQFTGKEKEFVYATLQELHGLGLIRDTACLIDTTTHSVCVLPTGIKELELYKKRAAKKFLLWFIPVFLSIVGILIAIVGLFL